MKIYIPVFLLLCLLIRSEAQTLPIGHRQQTFIDSSRSNRPVPCEIYYSSTVAGENTPVAPGIFPILAFGHGFVMTWSAYDIYWKALVPLGYIMVFPTTESSLSPSHLNFGKDLAFICKAMKKEGNDPSSVFYGSVDAKSAVMGHSMGGGCAFLAMQYDTSITVMATMAAAVTNPSSIIAGTTVFKPALVFSGSNDCVTPPPAHQIPMYDSLVSQCKTFVSITGADHCQFASYNFLCSFGQSTCSPQAAISDSTQQNLTFSCLIPWLNFYLKNDCNSASQFQGLLSAGAGFTNQQNCTLNCNTSNLNEELLTHECLAFPNPFANNLFIQCSGNKKGEFYNVTNSLGRIVLDGIIDSEDTEIDFTGYPAGLYVISINGNSRYKIIKQN